MGVITTPNIYKALTFDGASSRTYGVYITGEAVYNAPERDVEMISIPGRNGAFALDRGRFQNITVTYPAGIFAENETDFAAAVSDFRNYLCSRSGYCRLTDEYNPDEYRLTVYKSGLEVEPAQLKAGEFNIVFECQPQRFLTSGETAVSVANNGTIANPTLFASRPTIEFNGYGNIGIGGQSITVTNDPLGKLLLANGESFYHESYKLDPVHSIAEVTFDASLLNTGDSIFFGETTVTETKTAVRPQYTVYSASVYSQSGAGANTTVQIQGLSAIYTTIFEGITFTKGTSASVTHTVTSKTRYTKPPSSSGFELMLQYDTTVAYDGSGKITITSENSVIDEKEETLSQAVLTGVVNGVSTKTIPSKITVDLDIGEATWSNSGTPASANNNVQLGAKLPTLASGNNTITYSNTITNFKVTPHWWKV